MWAHFYLKSFVFLLRLDSGLKNSNCKPDFCQMTSKILHSAKVFEHGLTLHIIASIFSHKFSVWAATFWMLAAHKLVNIFLQFSLKDFSGMFATQNQDSAFNASASGQSLQ
jgi:hypothetical protein